MTTSSGRRRLAMVCASIAHEASKLEKILLDGERDLKDLAPGSKYGKVNASALARVIVYQSETLKRSIDSAIEIGE